jgi:hypothetical protein
VNVESRGRLKEGYSAYQLCEAIDGCRRSLFHMGANEHQTVYDDIALICRSGEKVEFFRAKVGGAAAARDTLQTPEEWAATRGQR